MAQSLTTARNALQILKAFTPEQPEWGVRELSGHLGWSRSTTHLLLSTLASEGFLMQSPDRRYRLGWAIFELGSVFLSGLELREQALPVMRRLNQRFNEVVHLAVLDRGEAVYVEKVTSPKSIQLFTRLGLRYPAYCTGVGKALIAHAPEAVIREISLIPFTPQTIVDPDVFRQELARIRVEGVSYDREETLVGLSCVAAPIYDFTGEVIAALSISLPTVRFIPAESCLTSAVKEASSEISRSLGFLPNARGYRFASS
jgi:DNA-binding IclR family transcriptional regulator